MNRRLVIDAIVADVVSILAFVALGRSSHDEGGNAVTEAVKVAAPFLIALAVGWLVARAWNSPTSPTTGMVIWGVTITSGMVLRRFVFDRGTALAFIIVASVFTLVFLVGWRFAWEWWSGRRRKVGT
jgi:FtsH-binding integral membrane protein